MGQTLQTTFLKLLLTISISLVWGGICLSFAQISLVDDTSLEVRFSQGQTERDETSYTIALSEISRIISSEFSPRTNSWQSYNEVEGNSNYYVPAGIYGTAAGRVQLIDSDVQTYFTTSFKNDSEFSLGNIILAYDFIYNFYESESEHKLTLRYKVNDGNWKTLPNGIIEESSLRSVENEWSSFSLHLNVDDIYLRPSDTIHLMWVFETQNEVTKPIPLALQRMEIYPQKVSQRTLERGDLIISEILPGSEVNGTEFEYVEVYNPGENPVSLKGIEIVTDRGSKVIQQNVFVNPYDFTVISNADISSIDGVNNSYFYNGSLIKPEGGRVELIREGIEIASATYEPSETGVSMELNRISRAYDGYSSMQDFISSQTTYFQDLLGSPGFSGGTSPMFKKTLEASGIYLLSMPGDLVQNLNRNNSIEFFSLDGVELEMSSVEPYTPVFIKKVDENPVTLVVENNVNISGQKNFQTTEISDAQFVQTPIRSGNRQEADYLKDSISEIFPVTQIWSSEQKKFNLKLSEQASQNNWTPLIVHNSIASLLESAENRLISPQSDRFIEFGILPENQDSEMLADVVMVGFLDVSSQYNQIRYDLPKLKLTEPYTEQTNKLNSHQLYLTSTLSKENFNSFTHLPEDINEEYEIGLGYQISDDAGSAILRWKFTEEIPDEWVITLEDTYNNTSVNLRDENEYRFRYSANIRVEEELTEAPKISMIKPEERPRFVVRIEPYKAFSNSVSETEEVPNSIELRPNYPNPFNPSTNINFFLPEERNVRVGIYNVVGQQVALLLDDVVQQGEHSIQWDASDKPSGIYIVQLESGNRIFTRKITLIK